jgi:D-serine deaminase-like pyridoxal phosphate-dependent protein
MFNLNGPARLFMVAELNTMKVEMGYKRRGVQDWRQKKLVRTSKARAALKAAGLKPHRYFYHAQGDAEAKAKAQALAEDYVLKQRAALKAAGIRYPCHVSEGMAL